MRAMQILQVHAVVDKVRNSLNDRDITRSAPSTVKAGSKTQ